MKKEERRKKNEERRKKKEERRKKKEERRKKKEERRKKKRTSTCCNSWEWKRGTRGMEATKRFIELSIKL
jgi:hypothetical protein